MRGRQEIAGLAAAAMLVIMIVMQDAVASPLPAERPTPPPPRPAAIAEGAALRASANLSFNAWIEGFRPRALEAGIPAEVFDGAMEGVRYDTDVVQRDRTQSEFTRTIWDYLDSAVSEDRVRNGREALGRHRAVLDRIEAHYGVEKEIVLAVWGLESAYGSFRGRTPTIAALATLAFDGRRAAFFEGELIAALRILASGDITPDRMTGSWAGAMGHTQFMPSSYLALAVDFDGDGRRDIWSDDPTDALASAAAYLAHHGWTRGQPWGVEVRVPRGFDYALTGERVKKPATDWASLGIRAADGSIVPDHGPASILMPAGAQGAAFMIFPNFAVIERYNPADAYVIGIGHLADRIAGRPPIGADWPREDRALTLAEREELQERLTGAGFSTGGIDGKIGPNTIAAVRAFQTSLGMEPDGYANPALLDRLR
jgi:membrane-bound lytic murein transglycosylase B